MLAIRSARLFDGVVGRSHPLVLVDGQRIVEVDTTGAAEPPPGSELVDLGDATLLPGLIDAHLHLVLDGSADPIGHLSEVDDQTLAGEMTAAARRTLRAGITTVRDLGDRSYLSLRLRERVAADPTLGPDVLASGPPLTTPTGHCWFLGGGTHGEDGVRRSVREHAERGVDVIKVMATGGEITPGSRSHECQFGPAELRAAADEAHRHGLPITAHAHSAEGMSRALQAGFDGIEHATFLTADGVEADPAVIEALVAAQIPIIRTVGLLPSMPPPPRIAALLARAVPIFQQMVQAGARFVIASDAGIAAPKPHPVLAYGIAMAAKLGMGNSAALAAATSVAATACGLADRKGRVAAGYDADLLAVRGDPLDDIETLQHPIAVLHRGALITVSS
ncbi:MAG: amidohydrolase family protein [Frankiaceae bacterium]